MKRILAILIFLALAISIVTPAAAQGNYYFAVEKTTVHVYWNSDGTMSLDYTWVFVNQPNGHAIEFVDVGTPNDSYGDILADVNGNPVSISTDYQGEGGSGFAVDLGSHSIQPGQRGTVHVYIGRVERVLYPDTSDDNYASAVFAPTYFGSQYVTGTTDYTVTFHLPPGVQPEEPRWHDAPSGFSSEPQTGYDELGNIIYTWYNAAGSVARQPTFGASFPKTYVPAGAIYTPPVTPLISSDTIFTLMCLCFFAFIFLSIGDQFRQVIAQGRFAAGEDDVRHAEVKALVNDREPLLGGQLGEVAFAGVVAMRAVVVTAIRQRQVHAIRRGRTFAERHGRVELQFVDRTGAIGTEQFGNLKFEF